MPDMINKFKRALKSEEEILKTAHKNNWEILLCSKDGKNDFLKIGETILPSDIKDNLRYLDALCLMHGKDYINLFNAQKDSNGNIPLYLSESAKKQAKEI